MNDCLFCQQPTKRNKFCSDKCKTDYFNERKGYKEEYDPLLALWSTIIIPDNIPEETKTLLHIHKENIKKMSDLGRIMWSKVQHRVEEIGAVQFMQNFVTTVSITFSSITFSTTKI